VADREADVNEEKGEEGAGAPVCQVDRRTVHPLEHVNERGVGAQLRQVVGVRTSDVGTIPPLAPVCASIRSVANLSPNPAETAAAARECRVQQTMASNLISLVLNIIFISSRRKGGSSMNVDFAARCP